MLLFKVIIITISFTTILFSSSIGTLSGLTGEASVERDGKLYLAKTGLVIFEKDRILTKRLTRVQLTFIDKTVITLGQYSDFSIDKYSYDGIGSPVAHFKLNKGTMRASTGLIGKKSPKSFKVSTVDMGIGVLGTIFTVVSLDDGVQKAFCTYGAITVAVDNQTHTVTQGSFLNLSSSGEVKLQVMTKQNLKEATLESEETQEESSNTDDETTQSDESSNTDEIALPTVPNNIDTVGQLSSEEDSQESLRIEQEQLEDDRLAQVEAERVEAERVEAERVEAERLAEIDRLTFDYQPTYTTANDMITGNSHFTLQPILTYNIIGDGTSVSLKNSYIVDNFLIVNKELEKYKWKFTIADIALESIEAQNSFQTTFDNIILEVLDDGAKRATNINITSSNFQATGDDLSATDDMNWGEWEIAFSYDDENSANKSEERAGVWITGFKTDPAIIGAYTSDRISYSGKYKAILEIDNSIVHGSVTATINFGTDNGSLIIGASGNIASETYVLALGSQGQVSNNGGSRLRGNFIGATGNSMAGEFETIDSNDADNLPDAKGVFQITTIATLK